MTATPTDPPDSTVRWAPQNMPITPPVGHEPQQPVKNSGREHDVLEILAAIVLGFAVLAIAWSSLQSALWSGVQARETTESVLLSNDANDGYQRADGIKTQDQILFVEWLTRCNVEELDDLMLCEQIVGNMSPAGLDAFEVWLENEEQFLVFETDAYWNALNGDADEASAESLTRFELAGQANTNGDRYETASSALATVLFFGGISLVVGNARVRWALLAAAAFALMAAGGYLATLPVA